jgi:hypothetical protein
MKHHHHQQTFGTDPQPTDIDWDGIVIVTSCVLLLVLACLGLWWLA